MRVLFTTDYYAPHRGGGTETVVRQLAESLASRGHDVHVATLNTRRATPFQVLGGVHVHRFPMLDLTSRLRLQLSVSPAFVTGFGALVDRIEPDLINAHNVFFTSTPVALAVARRRGVRSVLTLHLNSPAGLAFPSNVLALTYEKTVGRLCAGLADQVVAVGPSVAASAQRTWGLAEQPVVIPNGVNSQQFAPPLARPERPVALFVGRLLANKGPQVFVAAAQRLLAAGLDAEFWLAGDGPLLDRLQTAADGDPRIRFLGHRDDVAGLMQSATVLARPSTLEGLPLTVLEAMAAGLAVVATDIPGNADLIEDGRTGLLCRPESPDDLAGVLGRALQDPSYARSLGQAARARVLDAFTWDAVSQKFEALALQINKDRACKAA